ncbi:hypothetical protein [Paenibacillus sp. HW567]|uniref:hypothetical protein n=1 Tax=Paenibacillus sp. HW567 TaxID=1034769 RepID=UPI0003613622|nr:hypothetical protein [Paenibacillus sp. HW567]
MKVRISLFLAMLSLVFVIGCDNNKNIVSQAALYPLPSTQLEIAVVGDNPFEKIKNVNYAQKSLEEITAVENNTFDGLIITKEYFSEAVKQEYKDFFSNITYPVFFIGTENLLTNVFHDNRLTLETAKIGGFGANVSGFVKTNGKIQEWGLFLPDNPTETDKNHDMILRITNIIESFKINHK